MHADKTSVNNIANNPCDGACCFKTLLVNHMYKKVVISSPKKDRHANLSGDHSNHVDNFGVLFASNDIDAVDLTLAVMSIAKA